MNKDFELSDISRYRSELMGLAIIFVIMFHTYVPMSDTFYGLHRIGSVGVDIFLFLSGIGLWFSWTKKDDSSIRKDYIPFIRRRLVRIYPAWLTVACIFFIPQIKSEHALTGALNILTYWKFWVFCDLKFWYVAAIMALYLIAPFYMQLIRRNAIWRWSVVAAFLWCIAIVYVTPIHATVGHLEIFWSRIPIFLLGINAGESIKKRKAISGDSIAIAAILFIASASLCIYLEQMKHGRFPIFLERMAYIPLAVSAIMLLCKALSHVPKSINNCFAWVGTISLEIYLVHFQYVMKYIYPYDLGYWPLFLLTLAGAIPLAWLLSQSSMVILSVCGWISSKFGRRI